MSRGQRLLLLMAFIVALLARLPGVFWGFNFPGGRHGHHVDEYTHVQLARSLMNPNELLEWKHPYPLGMAVHAALPLLGWYVVQGKAKLTTTEGMPKQVDPMEIIPVGRFASALYGAATVFIVFLIGRQLFTDPRISLLAAWFTALGGLHVSQSHFFLSDIPSLFWQLLGTYLLLREMEQTEDNTKSYLSWAALCLGISFGLKLFVVALPSLAIASVMRSPRVMRVVNTTVFFVMGFVLVNFGSYTPYELLRTVVKGTDDPYIQTFWSNILLYLVEFPSIVSLPVVLLFVGGLYPLARKLIEAKGAQRRMTLWLIVVLPLAINLFFLLLKLDHFPRHVIPFIPWIALVAGWSLAQIAERFRFAGWAPAIVLVPIFAYLAIFVYDGERVFIHEPRNSAAQWLMNNVPKGAAIYWRTHTNFPGYQAVSFPDNGRPPVLVMEMYRVNPMLSGSGWKNSYPRDHRYVFEARSQRQLDAFQAVFKGESEYREAARFGEGYFMPEYVWQERLTGNRARNYVSEIVIFMRPPAPEDAVSISPALSTR